MKHKNCSKCKKSYQSFRTAQRYCSNECRQAHFGKKYNSKTI